MIPPKDITEAAGNRSGASCLKAPKFPGIAIPALAFFADRDLHHQTFLDSSV
jgi:hypothetical protein